MVWRPVTAVISRSEQPSSAGLDAAALRKPCAEQCGGPASSHQIRRPTVDKTGNRPPPATGGAEIGPAPFQLLAAALGECTAMTVRWCAERQKWPLDHVAVDVTHRKEIIEGRDDKMGVFRKAVHSRGPALSAAQREKLFEIAAKRPVQRTL